MMKSKVKYLISISLLAATFSANSAIIYQADDRYINHGQGGTFTPSVDYADFVDDYWAWETGAFQNTSVNSTGMSGSGSTYAGLDATNYGYDSTSVFSVSFGVDELTDFSLNGSLDTLGYSDSFLSVTLKENGLELFALDSYDLISDGVNQFSYSGQFNAGSDYQLILSSQSYNSDYYSEEWKFNLQTTSVVPVPAAVWLFGSGLIALVGFSRKRT